MAAKIQFTQTMTVEIDLDAWAESYGLGIRSIEGTIRDAAAYIRYAAAESAGGEHFTILDTDFSIGGKR